MEKRNLFRLAVVFFVAALAGGTLFLLANGYFGDSEGDLNLSISSFTTDKDNYESHDRLDLNVGIDSSEPVDNVQIRICGIQNSVDNWIDEVRWENLESGGNEITLEFQMPACSACAGYREGTYHIYGELIQGGKVFDKENTSLRLS